MQSSRAGSILELPYLLMISFSFTSIEVLSEDCKCKQKKNQTTIVEQIKRTTISLDILLSWQAHCSLHYAGRSKVWITGCDTSQKQKSHLYRHGNRRRCGSGTAWNWCVSTPDACPPSLFSRQLEEISWDKCWYKKPMGDIWKGERKKNSMFT